MTQLVESHSCCHLWVAFPGQLHASSCSEMPPIIYGEADPCVPMLLTITTSQEDLGIQGNSACVN